MRAETNHLLHVIRNHINDWYSNCCDIHNMRDTAHITSSRQEVFCEKDVLRNFTKFT